MMNPFDRKQVAAAKRRLRDTSNYTRPGDLSKPEAMVLLKQAGITVGQIDRLLATTHSDEERGDLWTAAMRLPCQR
jgi:hypothetical protein